MFLYRRREVILSKWLPFSDQPASEASKMASPRQAHTPSGVVRRYPSFAAMSGASGLSVDSDPLLCASPFPFLTWFLPGVLFLLFHAFRQRVLRKELSFPTPEGFVSRLFVLENSRPSAVLPSGCLLSRSAWKVSVDQLCSGCCR